MSHPTILCTIRYPPRTVQVLLETYYRFMGYRVAYVTGTLPRLSTTPYTVLPPGQHYDTMQDALAVGIIAFAVVDRDFEASWLAERGIQSFRYTEEGLYRMPDMAWVPTPPFTRVPVPVRVH